jgi:hypothetical protein
MCAISICGENTTSLYSTFLSMTVSHQAQMPASPIARSHRRDQSDPRRSKTRTQAALDSFSDMVFSPRKLARERAAADLRDEAIQLRSDGA